MRICCRAAADMIATTGYTLSFIFRALFYPRNISLIISDFEKNRDMLPCWRSYADMIATTGYT